MPRCHRMDVVRRHDSDWDPSGNNYREVSINFNRLVLGRGRKDPFSTTESEATEYPQENGETRFDEETAITSRRKE